MPNKHTKKRANRKQCITRLLSAVLVLFVGVVTLGQQLHLPWLPTWDGLFALAGLRDNPQADLGELTVTFLDVGQGDCVFISAKPSFFALIDGGEAENASKVIQYLKSRGVERLDYVFATHPHSDHIGALAQILAEIPAGHVLTPKPPDRLVPATQGYTAFLDAVERSGAEAVFSKPGTVIPSGAGEIQILGPVKEMTDLNNNSLILRLVYGSRSFLFTGDAEGPAEKALLESGVTFKSDVWKAGHHGSQTSGNHAFLKAASPEYAVISCGQNNAYGHPDPELTERLSAQGITYYRTDFSGNVTCNTNGGLLYFTTERNAA